MANASDDSAARRETVKVMIILKLGQPADFPVGQIEQKCMNGGKTGTLPPVLAGIRAGKFGRLTFPCEHSG